MRRTQPRTAFERIEDCTCALEIGTLRRVQLHRRIIHKKGTWALVVFQAQDHKRLEGRSNPPFVIIQRYVKRAGLWRKHSHINLRGDQSVEILKVAALWEAMAVTMSAADIDLGAAIEQADAGAPTKKARRRKNAEPFVEHEVDLAQPT